MNKNSIKYLTEIADFNIKKFWNPEWLSLVIVSHILPDTFDFIKVLKKYFDISYIIPKPNSIKDDIYRKFEEDNFNLLKLSRSEINNNPDIILDKLKTIENKFIILDIWWYFSEIYIELKNYFWNKFIWIIEDTENWHQKYEKNIKKSLDLPIFSVARSNLKDHEDLYVWKWVVFSTEYVLRENNTNLSWKQPLVLWFWKIWKSISRELIWKWLQPFIYDIDSYRLLDAHSLWYHCFNRDESLIKSDIIFSATWNHWLKWEDYLKLKDWVIISSVTSVDDELDIEFLEKNFKKEKNKYFDKYTYNWKSIFLLNWWNAINFVTNESIWEYIFLVQAEIIHNIFSILNNKQEFWIIKITSNEEKKYIPEIWLKHFNN